MGPDPTTGGSDPTLWVQQTLPSSGAFLSELDSERMHGLSATTVNDRHM